MKTATHIAAGFFLLATVAGVSHEATAFQAGSLTDSREKSAAIDSDSLARWHHGPVRYLLRGVEAELYRSLVHDGQRLAFIGTFWARRDGNPATLENETRDDFWRRVARANRLFTRTTVPGWRTDMGRVYITMGPPYDREVELMPHEGESGVTVGVPVAGLSGNENRFQTFGAGDPNRAFYGMERWTYRNLNAPSLPAEMVVAFRKRADGSYELSSNPRDIDRFAGDLGSTVPALHELTGIDALEGEIFAQGNALNQQQAPGDNRSQAVSGAVNLSVPSQVGAALITDPETAGSINVQEAFNRMAAALDLGRATHIPDHHELVAELITSRDFFGILPFQMATHYYGTTGATVLATVTIGLPEEALSRQQGSTDELELAARLEGISSPGYQRLFSGPQLFTALPPTDTADGLRVMQAVIQMPPGRYRLSVGVRDRGAGIIAAGEEMLQVPEFSHGGLALSSICLARHVVPVQKAADSGETIAAFRLGRYAVVPRLHTLLEQDESLAIYYQVYGAVLVEGQPLLRLTYELFRVDAHGDVPMGEALVRDRVQHAVQAWELPVRHWPAGSYRMKISVHDMQGGGTVQGETLFSVNGAGAVAGTPSEGSDSR